MCQDTIVLNIRNGHNNIFFQNYFDFPTFPDISNFSQHFLTFPDISRHFPTFPNVSGDVGGCRWRFWWGTFISDEGNTKIIQYGKLKIVRAHRTWAPRRVLTVTTPQVKAVVPTSRTTRNRNRYLKSTNLDDGARLDVRARGFWRDGQNAFFDVRVTNPDNKSQSTTRRSKQFFVNTSPRRRDNTIVAWWKLNMAHLHHWSSLQQV